MTHPVHRITGFERVAPYALRLRFEDGVETVVDLADMLEGELYGPLRDPFVFARVAIGWEIRRFFGVPKINAIPKFVLSKGSAITF